MATQNGRTTDEVAADALKRYLALEWVKRLSREGDDNRRRLGLETHEEGEEYVDRVVTEHRRGIAGAVITIDANVYISVAPRRL
jgi:hypothetical protein